jgi:diketogulonate reductase-like aldo/keto reductase
VRACEQSLKRLGTDRLDCYLLHWPGSHPLADTFAAFEELKAAGKILSYGVSNFDEEQIREAAALGTVACNQVLYNLGERHVEARVFPVCRELGIACVGYSPFAELPPEGEFGDATPRQVALAFLAREAFQIPKAERVAHVRENAARVTLSEAQVRRLDQAYPVHVRRELPTA